MLSNVYPIFNNFDFFYIIIKNGCQWLNQAVIWTQLFPNYFSSYCKCLKSIACASGRILSNLKRSSQLAMSLIQRGLHAEIQMVKSWGFANVTYLCIFFHLQHVGGQPKHWSYRAKKKTSLIQSLVMCICLLELVELEMDLLIISKFVSWTLPWCLSSCFLHDGWSQYCFD